MWRVGLLVLMLVAAACRSARREEITPSISPTETPRRDVGTPTAVWTVPPTSTPLPPAPTPTAEFLFTPTPWPTAAPTPFPDAQQIVDLIVGHPEGPLRDRAGHWATHLAIGSFTAPGADERVALVGNIGAGKEVRWVVVGPAEGKADAWQLRGSSEWLGAGFDEPPSFYLPPELLDFDGDGRQELLSHYFRVQRGGTVAVDTLYRWNGQTLATVWGLKTLQDNTAAEERDLSRPYKEDSRVEWEWDDADRDGLSDDIRAYEHVTFYSPAGELWGEENWERTFCWNGDVFQPCWPGAPAPAFVYTDLGELWVWQDHAARALNVQNVRGFRWSPEGRRIAWWAGPVEEGCPTALVGVHDLRAGDRQEIAFALDTGDGLAALHWSTDGRVVYALSDRSTFLLDPTTGRRTFLSVAPAGAWSPAGDRVAYEREGNLYLYQVAQGQERLLIAAPVGNGAPQMLAGPAWSPVGDRIAGLWGDGRVMALALVSPTIVDAVSSAALLGEGAVERPDGSPAGQTSPPQIVWAPDGSAIALVWTASGADVAGGGSSTDIYLAAVPADEGLPVQPVELRAVFHLTSTGALTLAWSPDGGRVALMAGGDVWEVSTEGEARLRYHFSVPQVDWNLSEWSPDGAGFLAGLERTYGRYLYWFPANGDAPVWLLAGVIGRVEWAPYAEAARSTVWVEYKGETPVLHFVSSDGSDVAVRAKGADRFTSFHVGGKRVFYNKFYADRGGAASLSASGVLAGCRSPLASPSGERLAWLCDDGLPDWSAIISGTAQIHFRLILSDQNGRNTQEVWSYVESGPEYRNISLMGWRQDEQAVFLSRPRYGTAWAYFDYNPGIMALDLATGQTRPIGDLDGIHDARVSADERWLAQSRVEEWPREGVTILLRSLPDGAEREFPAAEGTTVAGDFSFSPGNVWLAWREWTNKPEGATVLLRALRLPDGEPLTLYEEADATAPRIGGWLGESDLVFVYPVLDDGSGGHSTRLTLPGVGPGEPLSPYAFLGAVWK